MTVEKVLVVLVLAAVILGPHRLPAYAHRLAALVRSIRTFTEAARTHVEREVGAPLALDEWRSLDPRRYDPRRIVRDALIAAPGSGVVDDTSAAPSAEGEAAAAAQVRAAAIRAAAAAPGGWRPPATAEQTPSAPASPAPATAQAA